ncbi:Phytochelatin synthase-domain-containing protein [Radiomyces spectabilis]|uniref:Phytochelatin synthase-domain-containing protein n=1 Tax=Radiomyces spectabilis TaxID=64574 RepID=UPI00221EBEB4|nr:Phytochelatin synthase-domain-containing protein [Radiomyces spectabilis]KAI8379671.1 Phytochelatin synthase-domain-containing protein [Radiomyces spectabilis]
MASRTFCLARRNFDTCISLKSSRLPRTWFPGSQAYRQATTAVHSLKHPVQDIIHTLPSSTPRKSLVNFTSAEGKRLFRGAMDQGRAESFFKLMGNFSAQSSPAKAGMTSLAMSLNALEIDPKRIWKGNWRWFSGDQMQTCSPKEAISQHGIPFDEFRCLAQAHCDVDARRASSAGYRQFLSDLQYVTSNPNSQMVINYSRSRLGQPGESHFSPIGGYNATEGMALIMDVARDQYPSVWVDTRTLYEAMLDKESIGLSRGYFILRPGSVSHLLRCQTCTRRACSNRAVQSQ